MALFLSTFDKCQAKVKCHRMTSANKVSRSIQVHLFNLLALLRLQLFFFHRKRLLPMRLAAIKIGNFFTEQNVGNILGKKPLKDRIAFRIHARAQNMNMEVSETWRNGCMLQPLKAKWLSKRQHRILQIGTSRKCFIKARCHLSHETCICLHCLISPCSSPPPVCKHQHGSSMPEGLLDPRSSCSLSLQWNMPYHHKVPGTPHRTPERGMGGAWPLCVTVCLPTILCRGTLTADCS